MLGDALGDGGDAVHRLILAQLDGAEALIVMDGPFFGDHAVLPIERGSRFGRAG